jgi:hypothetical protein
LGQQASSDVRSGTRQRRWGHRQHYWSILTHNVPVTSATMR